MTGSLVKGNELEKMWNKLAIAYLKDYSGICLEQLRKITKFQT